MIYPSLYSLKVELKDDNLFEWRVQIFKVDPDSKLTKDLNRLKEEKGQDNILFSFTFSNEFPFKPPFVRVISPGMSQFFFIIL